MSMRSSGTERGHRPFYAEKGETIMPFDIVGFSESQAAAALTKFAAVVDRVYRTANTDDLFIKECAPFLGAMLFASESGGGSGTFRYGELRQPSLKIPYRTQRYMGINGTKPEGGMVNFFANPLPLYAGEKLNALIQNAGTERNQILLWLVSGPVSRAEQEAVRITHAITGYADQTMTVNEWTFATMVWDQALPKGRYAVVGMEGGSYVSGGGNYDFATARLVFPDTTWRPGCILREMWGDKVSIDSAVVDAFHAMQRWPLMPEISFAHDSMPNIELLGGHARTDHCINLLLQKIG